MSQKKGYSVVTERRQRIKTECWYGHLGQFVCEKRSIRCHIDVHSISPVCECAVFHFDGRIPVRHVPINQSFVRSLSRSVFLVSSIFFYQCRLCEFHNFILFTSIRSNAVSVRREPFFWKFDYDMLLRFCFIVDHNRDTEHKIQQEIQFHNAVFKKKGRKRSKNNFHSISCF